MNNIVRKELFELEDKNYKIFATKLLPNVDNLIGVRLPYLRNIAKRIALQDWQQYLEYAESNYFEEVMLQGMVIGYVKTDICELLKYVKKFIPKINNWSVCDSFCFGLKITEKNLNIVFNFLKPYFYSRHEFEVRFSVVMLLKWFNKQEYIESNLKILKAITNNGYYAKMAVAWAISVFYITFSDIILLYLKNNNINDFIYNESIKKIKESTRVSNELKDKIYQLKKQNNIDGNTAKPMCGNCLRTKRDDERKNMV